MRVVLTAEEIGELRRQNPSTAGDGGFQGLLVRLQKNVDASSGELTLSDDDLRRIPMYAFDYNNGGWESRLRRAFGRTLGPNLGRA